MSKLAIIDVDGVIANSDKRFEMAKREDGSTDWKVAFNPSLLVHDELIEGVKEAIQHLYDQGYTIVYLTSRPEHMKQMSVAFLNHHGIGGPEYFDKAEADKYIKTTAWKARVVQELTRRNQYERFLFVDDDEKNRLAVMELAMGNVDCFASLVEALSADDYRKEWAKE